MQTVSKTSALLWVATRFFLGTATAGDVQACAEAIRDWPAVADAAVEEGVEGILLHVLQDVNLTVPLESMALRTIQLNSEYVTLLYSLGKDLATHGVQAIVLKGGALLPRVYVGKFGRRPLRDLDLLVRPADAERLRELLRARGFQRLGDNMEKGRLSIDVHERIVASRIRTLALAFRFDEDALWQSSRPLFDEQPNLRILDPAYEYCHLAVHALKHSFNRLIWLVDLALLRPAAIDDRLVEVATATNSLRTLTYVFALLEGALGMPPPRDVVRLQVPLGNLERRFLHAVEARQIPEAMGELVTAESIVGASRRMRYLAELCFPRPSVLEASFQGTPRWLLYPRRFCQLVDKALRERSRLLRMTRSSDGQATRQSAPELRP